MMRILIYTDGSPRAATAVDFTAPLARASGAAVTVLGTGTSRGGIAAAQAAVADAATRLPPAVQAIVRPGKPLEEILLEDRTGLYDLLVIDAPVRRGLAQLLCGSVASRLVRYARTPVLIVKGPVRPVRRILACTGGGEPGERVAVWAGQAAKWLDAEVTVLHVMSQMALSAESWLDEPKATAEAAMADATPEGRHLARALELMRAQGADAARLRPALRHGLVLDEITAEAAEGDYDLVAVGAHTPSNLPAGWDWLGGVLFDDVADQIIWAVKGPVLVVRNPPMR